MLVQELILDSNLLAFYHPLLVKGSVCANAVGLDLNTLSDYRQNQAHLSASVKLQDKENLDIASAVSDVLEGKLKEKMDPTDHVKEKDGKFCVYDANGKVVKDGDQIKIGGNDSYKVLCRKHFRELTKLI